MKSKRYFVILIIEIHHMKTRFFFIFFCLFSIVSAQKKSGPIVKDYGAVFSIEKPDLTLKSDQVYKVIFDVYTNSNKTGEINPLINTVARYLNMHAQVGVPAENMKVALVLHGRAAKDALSDQAYLSKYGSQNPNAGLISALNEAGVEVFVCGQSYKSRGLPLDGLSKDVKLSLSALTALVEYQEQGYKVINFN